MPNVSVKPKATKPEKFSVTDMANAMRTHRGVVSKVAEALQCSRTTVYRYINQHPTVAKAREEANDVILDIAESGLHAALLIGEAWAIKFVLMTKGQKRGYTTRQILEADGVWNLKVEYIDSD